MKKRIAVIAGLLSVAILGGCGEWEEKKYTFNGKSYSESELEEHLGDLLEVENSDLDIDVDLYEEMDD